MLSRIVPPNSSTSCGTTLIDCGVSFKSPGSFNMLGGVMGTSSWLGLWVGAWLALGACAKAPDEASSRLRPVVGASSPRRSRRTADDDDF